MNILIFEWLQKRFFEFRMGNKMYIGFTIALLNFVLIFHRFFIETIDSLHEILFNIVIFSVLFLIVYIPLALLIGNNHYKNQFRIDSTLEFLNDPATLKSIKLFLDLKTNNADMNEVNNFKKLLYKWEKETITTDLK